MRARLNVEMGVTLVLLGLCTCMSHADVVVNFDAATQVAGNSPNVTSDTALNTANPIVTSGNLTGYTGADVYGAMNERSTGLWTVGASSASGLRVRMNNSANNGVDGLFLFATAQVSFNPANDTLEASSVFTSQIQRVDSAKIRFVFGSGGAFYVSEASPDFVTGGSGNQSDSFSLEALSAQWFAYDPVSSASGVSAIGASVSPAFVDIDFIGFALFADGNAGGASNSGVNCGVRTFSALAVPSASTQAPTFDSDPVVADDAVTNQAYSDTLANYASDGDGDPMIFWKSSGPSWLSVAAEGTLSGTAPGTQGLNSWTVHVTDNINGTNSATLELTVGGPPVIITPYTGTNILFIAIDDINPIMGCYGNTLIQTPEMDSLASRGMLFENAHCQGSVCSASRASLMTGLMPEQTGVFFFDKMRGDAVVDSRDNPLGLTNLVTIPQHFINHGYETAAIGKLNDYRCVGSINANGIINEDGASVDDPPSWSYRFANPSGVGPTTAIRTTDAATVKLAAESVNQPAANFTDGRAATEAISVMNTLAAGNKPFFLGVGFKKPHLPFLAPKSSWDLYSPTNFTPQAFRTDMLNATTEYSNLTIQELRNQYYLETNGSGQALPITAGILPDDQQRLLLHGYYACISHIDEQVGRVLDELDTLGLTSNTIVVLWGDHGFHLGDHNKWGKHTHLEQASSMPLIISAPGFPQAVRTTAPVGLIDLYPTLCELAGLPVPEQPLSHAVATGRPLAGMSLVPILTDPDARVQTGIINQWGTSTYGYAYRTERYRFTEWINPSGTILSRELYDYELDPLETINLAVYPEYAALMYQFAKATRTTNEAGGCDRLKTTAALPFPSDASLVGLKMSGADLSWPEASGMTYRLLSKTNLLQAAWTTKQTGLPGSPAPVAQNEAAEFFRVEVE